MKTMSKSKRNFQNFQIKNKNKTISKSKIRKIKKIKKEIKVFTAAKNPRVIGFDYALISLGLNSD